MKDERCSSANVRMATRDLRTALRERFPDWTADEVELARLDMLALLRVIAAQYWKLRQRATRENAVESGRSVETIINT